MKEIITDISVNILESKIELKLDNEKMKEIGITPLHVTNALSKPFKGVSIKKKDDLIIVKQTGGCTRWGKNIFQQRIITTSMW